MANSGGFGNVRIFSQCARSSFKIGVGFTNVMEHTQCLLVEQGHLATMTNGQHPTRIVDRDTMDRAVEGICPDFML